MKTNLHPLSIFLLLLFLVVSCDSEQEEASEFKLGEIKINGQSLKVSKKFDRHIDGYIKVVATKTEAEVRKRYYEKEQQLPYGHLTKEVWGYDYGTEPIETRPPPDGGLRASTYPLFFTEDNRLKKNVDKLNAAVQELIKKMSVKGEVEFLFNYELVMANNDFVSILFGFSRCGNQCHEYMRSINFDLKRGVVLENSAFLEQLGISPKTFELALRRKFDKLYVSRSFITDGRYPGFKEIATQQHPFTTEETPEQNRYTADFNLLTRDASIVPVELRNRGLFLRVGLDVTAYNQTHTGFLDFEWKKLQKK